MKKTLLTALALILVNISSIHADTEEKGWVKTGYAGLTVIYSKESDAADLYKNLVNRRTPDKIKITKDTDEKIKAQALSKRIAQIFNEVIKLRKITKLKMTGRERIVIMKDRKQLADLYRKFYGKEIGRCISFYSSARKTVYTCEDVMSAKILAHEMTHMVNDLYYKGTLKDNEDENTAYGMEVYFKW